MADGSQGLVHWPGITGQIEADMTFSHGISPSVCTITVPAGTAQPAEHGTLRFTFGGTSITFPDCKLVETSINVGGSGQVQHLTIWDRRWKWWGGVSGIYNQRFADGLINADRERTPKQLADTCLAALLEGNGDASALDRWKDNRPEVNWEWDLPAKALADLGDFFGCRVVLGLDNRVRVVPNGEGVMLPEGAMTEDAIIYDPPEKPYELHFIGGPMRFQHDFGLIPVGRDTTDGYIKPIDKLSYRPSIGWEKEAFPWFENVRKEHGQAAWQWAKRCIWRWYRIWGNKDLSLPIIVPGYGALEDGWQIVPIENEQVATWKDTGIQHAGLAGKPPKVAFGDPGMTAGDLGFAAQEFLRKTDFLPNNENIQAQVFGERRSGLQNFKNTNKDDLYIQAFTIERDLAIVQFHDHVCRRVNAIRKPANIYLRCAVSVRHPDTRSWVRFWESRRIGNVITPPRVLKHDEVVLSHINGSPINLKECRMDSTHYLDAAEREYYTRIPQCRTYAGLLPISPDGAIHQVHWHVGPPYAWTKASRNNEFSLTVPGYEQRRKAEKLQKAWIDEIDAWNKWTRHIKQNRNPFEPGR